MIFQNNMTTSSPYKVLEKLSEYDNSACVVIKDKVFLNDFLFLSFKLGISTKAELPPHESLDYDRT